MQTPSCLQCISPLERLDDTSPRVSRLTSVCELRRLNALTRHAQRIQSPPDGLALAPAVSSEKLVFETIMPMEPVWLQCRRNSWRQCVRCGSYDVRELGGAASVLDWLACNRCAHVWGAEAVGVIRAGPTREENTEPIASGSRPEPGPTTTLVVKALLEVAAWIGKRRRS